MLQIGNGGSSLQEYTSEFSLWAEMAAPLIASTDIGALTKAELAIYENPSVVAVDQDPLGRPGVPISSANGLWVLTKQLTGGGRAVLLFNSTNTAATISTTAPAAGLPRARAYSMRNLWTNAVSETGGAISAFVPGRGVAMFTVSALPKRRAPKLAPHTVLSLDSGSAQLPLGQSTTLAESFANDGTSDIKRVALTLSAWPGWVVKPLGRTRVPGSRPAGGSRSPTASPHPRPGRRSRHRFLAAWRRTIRPPGERARRRRSARPWLRPWAPRSRPPT